ncbi:uncharacterized protein LOC121864512 isoform X2 [Homarus americanus]|uniref:uncharacterized protein LOC121864512 isoform X2 n=1 Tax=Homarus americanus TaxID=6706 RepID=UPI001C43E21D|nr:uncharacterized protein LOC121864512 isoform X2 [Homarus americanus]
MMKGVKHVLPTGRNVYPVASVRPFDLASWIFEVNSAVVIRLIPNSEKLNIMDLKVKCTVRWKLNLEAVNGGVSWCATDRSLLPAPSASAGKAVTLDTSPAAEPSYTSRRGGWGGPRLHHSSYLRRRHQMPSSTLPISTLILDKILRFLCHYLYSDVYFAGNSTLGLLL